MVEVYEECGILHHLDLPPIPQAEVVSEIFMLIDEILRPGFGPRRNLNWKNVGFFVDDQFALVETPLSEQISLALRTNPPNGRSIESVEGEATRLTNAFLDRMPTVARWLANDLEGAFRNDPAVRSTEEIHICYPGFYAIEAYRIAHELFELGVPLLPRMITEQAHAKTGIDIHPGARIGRGCFLDHGTGIVIGETSQIGHRVKIYQGVTLGALSFPRDEVTGEFLRVKRHPTIEDDVVIYANATILGGGTTIGHHSVIGASAWITRSVAPYTRVVCGGPNQHHVAEYNEELQTYPLVPLSDEAVEDGSHI